MCLNADYLFPTVHSDAHNDSSASAVNGCTVSSYGCHTNKRMLQRCYRVVYQVGIDLFCQGMNVEAKANFDRSDLGRQKDDQSSVTLFLPLFLPRRKSFAGQLE